MAIKIIYADVGALRLKKLAKYIPSEVGNMNRVFGHPNIVSVHYLSTAYILLERAFAIFCTFTMLFVTKTTGRPGLVQTPLPSVLTADGVQYV